MTPQTENKIILVTRKTRLDDLICRFNTIEQAKFYIEHLGADFSDYLNEDKIYKQAVRDSEVILKKIGRVQVLLRNYLPNFLFGKSDTVVVLGQDGLVANTLKYLNNQPVIAVNPDPARFDGVLLPFTVSDLNAIPAELFDKKRKCKTITMAQAKLNNGQILYGVNDLFVGQKTHVSARYEISIGKNSERQSSSGVIISTGLGSTGWLASILTGATNIRAHGHNQTNSLTGNNNRFPWDAKLLYYAVREPFPSKTSGTSMVFGQISKGGQLKIVSQMPENGVIFSDGIESDFLEFNSGTTAHIGIADKQGILVV